MPPPIFGPDEIDQSPNSVNLRAQSESDFWSNYFSQGASGGPPAQVGYDTTNADAARGWQQELMQDLQRQAAGDPNSRAQQSLAQGYGAARAGQSAIGSSARGTGGAAGLRAGAMGAGNVQRGYVGDQQMLLQQEKLSAQALLAQQLAQQRGQDAMQAGDMAATAQGNQSLNDAMARFYTGGGIQGAQGGFQTAADLASAQAGLDLEASDAQAASNQQIMQAGAAGFGALSRGFGSGGTNRQGGYRQVDGQSSIVPEWDK